jgi:hypothetical protein
MSPLVTAESVIALLAAIVVLVLAYVWLRRRYIAEGRPLMLCALRTEAEPRWRLGLARLSGARLDWFTVIGPSVRPRHSWMRHDLDLGSAVPVREPIPGLPDAVEVSGSCGATPCGLALSAPAYTALRAWLESSPPGFNVNVT